MEFLGRRAERATVDNLLTRARAGLSGAIVVRGEAGIGKTVLLEHARGAAESSGFRVVSSVGVESETQFAFAGLHQLCAPLLDRVGALPEPQRAALGVAFGQQGGAVPDRFLVGLATLTLLAEVAEEGPLLCLVDDAQWLDEASAQVLTFVARRVAAERMALVFALRDPTDRDMGMFEGIPVVCLGGLDENDARALLAAAAHTPLDNGMRDRVIAEACGNPLALLELARSAPAAWLAGGFELPELPGTTHRIEDTFRRRSGSLPVPTQTLLLVAALDSTGEVALLWRAAAHLGIAYESAAPAEAAGLLEIDTRVRFRHPLVRSAVLRAAAPLERRRAHDALAAVTDSRVDPERRAWHRAQAVLGTDEDAAVELVRSADRARSRGGLAASASFMEQAAKLTPDPAVRAGRALEAAHTKQEAGASEDALDLLRVAAAGPLDALQQARLELLRARIAFHLVRDRAGAGMLLDAARSLAPLDPALSRETYLHALEAAIVTGNFGRGRTIPEVTEAARTAPAATWPQRPVDLLLDGLVATFTQGYAAGVPGRRRAVEAFVNEPDADAVDGANGCRWGWLASRTAMSVFDDESLHSLSIRNVRLTREAGALATLPAALLGQSIMLVLSGEFVRAAEQNAFAAATGAVPLLHAQLAVSAWRGRPTETAEVHAAIVRKAAGPAHGTEESLTQYAMAVLHNGLGEYPAAYTAAKRAFDSEAWRFNNMAHSEFIEAACRSGRQESAAEALEQLTSRALASGTPWGLGLAARAQALSSTGPAAEEHYREAIEQLGRSRMATHLARSHLVYGEWLRREGRRQDAREQLRTAHGMLLDMGAEAFAARAARELRATGEHPRKRTAQPTDALTAHELHIARLVATGATSREVGTQLFLSPRTIEAHLRSIFRKLDINSRRQLRELSLPR
ncbi:AAA family ATPase [Arthrobacter gengyunqii]|uniref:AAA family ATPase n=1 Tax=Arthrobacter gengyunqii TaxID=2886940 RepID=A0A9X1S760_9MICC|nr:LuxR family transcriptional regulator [Arthrobacter gengyunqii]MCC3270598.1 AAA family ATPase [Arthrobacter gengyunqii]UOY97360.1 AAA family ATPase [Arthrobacter gengyunqii]